MLLPLVTRSPGAGAQTAVPTPVPVRIQTPDLAFVDKLQVTLGDSAQASGDSGLTLSIVPAEPASDQLLNDARSGARRFSGALVPNWSIADLVRDDFVLPVPPPSTPLAPAIAGIRSFGGEWITTDFDCDCDLLFLRTDLLAEATATRDYRAATGIDLEPAGSWDELRRQAAFFADRIGGGVALPQNHAQQVVDHFVAMAACHVLSGPANERFWFDPDTMEPSLDAHGFVQALDSWRQMALSTPDGARARGTGDLWQALLDGSVAYLVASSDFLPFALERGVDAGIIGVSELPGRTTDAGTVLRAGNVVGASWGGVVMAASSAATVAEEFFAYLADPTVMQGFWTDPGTGVVPGVTQAGAAQVVGSLESAGWPSSITNSWVDAIGATLSNAIQLPALRIAEAQRYLQALESRLVPLFASPDGDAKMVLSAAADDWRRINEAVGIETQRDLYVRSLMPAPV